MKEHRTLEDFLRDYLTRPLPRSQDRCEARALLDAFLHFGALDTALMVEELVQGLVMWQESGGLSRAKAREALPVIRRVIRGMMPPEAS